MCLPKLYSNVTLESYESVRYSDETFAYDGVGGTSPFAMALDTLATREVVQYVEKFALAGAFWDNRFEDSIGARPISDSAMLLATLVRVCLDRMSNVKEFR